MLLQVQRIEQLSEKWLKELGDLCVREGKVLTVMSREEVQDYSVIVEKSSHNRD